MSPERLRLHAAPREVVLAPEGEQGLGDALARHLQRRERAAYLRGERAGRSEALATAVKRLDEAAAQYEAAGVSRDSALASDCVDLALAIAAELVRVEVKAGRHAIEAIVRDMLAASGVGRGACKVHVSPADAEMLATVAFRSATVIEADIDVPRACVQVETPQGLLVRDLDAALASIGTRLREEAQS